MLIEKCQKCYLHLKYEYMYESFPIAQSVKIIIAKAHSLYKTPSTVAENRVYYFVKIRLPEARGYTVTLDTATHYFRKTKRFCCSQSK